MHASKAVGETDSKTLLKYRPEIDGLRAIAVISVILYHAEFLVFGRDWIEGGFVGVDIFFVISGYLITKIIVLELAETGKFNFSNFYERRARRILPMLFTVFLFFYPVGWLFLNPDQMLDFNRSIFAAVFFVSNMYFYFSTTEYGATAALLKPFLHTWSLAVEEQFYLVFPVVLLAVQKWLKRYFLAVFVVLILVSLHASEYLVERNPSLNFYWPVSRFWELLIGSVLAYFEVKGVRLDSGLPSKVFPLIGLCMIAYAIFFFDDRTPHPSYLTLVPVIGVALIICFSSCADFVGRLLASKFLVGIGLISYSLYLWHFPIFAFWRVIDPLPDNLTKIIWILLTLFLSCISFLAVEKPFRQSQVISKKKLVTSLGAFCLFLLVVTICSENTSGFNLANQEKIEPVESHPQGKIANTVLIGDSHAGALIHGLKRQLGSGNGLLARVRAGCIPFFNVDRYDYRFVRGACAEFTNSSYDLIIGDANLRTVIMSTMGPVYLTDIAFNDKDLARVKGQDVVLIDRPEISDNFEVFETGMRESFEKLIAANKEVIFVIDVPELGRDNAECLVESQVTYRPFGPKVPGESVDKEACRVKRKDFDDRVGAFHELVWRVSREFPDVRVVDPTELFCDDDYCYGYKGGSLLYRDVDHVNALGSILVAEEIVRVFNLRD